MKKELQPIILFLSALIIFTLLSMIGIVYTCGKAIKESFQVNFWQGIVKLIKFWLNILYQLWNVIKYLLMGLVITFDLFANVTAGELLEDFVTANEDTLYTNGNYTISAATGECEVNKKLNRKGGWLTNLLSKALGKNHSIVAYNKEKK